MLDSDKDKGETWDKTGAREPWGGGGEGGQGLSPEGSEEAEHSNNCGKSGPGGEEPGRGIEGEMNLVSLGTARSGWRRGRGGVGMSSLGVDHIGLAAVAENLAFPLSETGTSKVLSRT